MMLWIVFTVAVVAMLCLDLGVFHRAAHTVKFREAIAWTAAWFTLALSFMVGVYFVSGSQRALEFLTGYLIEWSLSVDNIFVFLIIFSYFAVPTAYHHKVLFWGILGAVVMRAILIAAGVVMLDRFHWMIYIFGAFLIITGLRLFFQEAEVHPERNPVLRIARRYLPITSDYVQDRFMVKRDGRRMFTPLFVVLLVVETTDVVFAVDSVPAVLAITTDPFIVYTSNVFAILGLRALYFAVSGLMQLFSYLRYGLAAILVFVGVKMTTGDFIEIPVRVALSVVAGILLVSISASLLASWLKRRRDAPGDDDDTTREEPVPQRG